MINVTEEREEEEAATCNIIHDPGEGEIQEVMPLLYVEDSNPERLLEHQERRRYPSLPGLHTWSC